MASVVRSCRLLRVRRWYDWYAAGSVERIGLGDRQLGIFGGVQCQSAYGQAPPELKVKVNERVEVSIKQRYGSMDVAI